MIKLVITSGSGPAVNYTLDSYSFIIGSSSPAPGDASATFINSSENRLAAAFSDQSSSSDMALTMPSSSRSPRFDLALPRSSESCDELMKVADIFIDDSLLQERHLQMVRDEEGWWVINLAHDPLATLNGLPFGRRPLSDQDLIQIGNSTIVIYLCQQLSEKKSDKEPEQLESVEDIHQLIMQVETLHPTPCDEISHSVVVASIVPMPTELNENIVNDFHVPNSVTQEHKEEAITSIKDMLEKTLSRRRHEDLHEFDEHEAHPLHHISSISSAGLEESHSRYWLLRRFALFFCIVFVLGMGTHFWARYVVHKKEMAAAEVIADVSMALFHAQMRGLHPQHQNWSDFEFIHNNLNEILPYGYPKMIDLDRQGHIVNGSYALRVYTSPDLSQFLVIAQPLPGMADWFSSRASIIVDSQAMEMRKIQDLKILNRLLVNNTLELTRSHEISHVVEGGELIPLSELTVTSSHQFLPPKVLALIYPHASNLIYNAPRYYFLGQQLIEQALNIVHDMPSESSVALFMRELAVLSQFPNLVLYGTDGISSAVEAQRALNVLVPDEHFLFGYLQFSNEGVPLTAYLLLDGMENEVASKEPPVAFMLEKSLYQVLTYRESHSSSIEEVSSPLSSSDEQHPIFLHLNGLAAYRQRQLEPVSERIVLLLKQHTRSLTADFTSKLRQLELDYLTIDQEQQKEIAKHLSTLSLENAHLPAALFLEFIHAAQMDATFNMYLESIKAEENFIPYTHDFIEDQLTQIGKSMNWEELYIAVNRLEKMLQFELLPEIDLLVESQAKASGLTIQRLNHFILSYYPLCEEGLDVESRKMLVHILRGAWITDRELCDFYLAEFDARPLTLVQ